MMSPKSYAKSVMVLGYLGYLLKVFVENEDADALIKWCLQFYRSGLLKNWKIRSVIYKRQRKIKYETSNLDLILPRKPERQTIFLACVLSINGPQTI